MRYRENTLKLEEQIENEISFTVYPNPVTDKVIISTKELSSPYSFIISNALGEIVKSEQNISNNILELNVNNLVILMGMKNVMPGEVY